jgi:hypothetical protein
MTTIQKIKLPLNYDPPQFYCPACGAPILGNFDAQICQHLVYVTDPSGSGDDLIGAKYTKIFEEVAEAIDDSDDELIEKFLEINDKESFLRFDVKFGGMSHSVEWYNITAVFDFAP